MLEAAGAPPNKLPPAGGVPLAGFYPNKPPPAAVSTGFAPNNDPAGLEALPNRPPVAGAAFPNREPPLAFSDPLDSAGFANKPPAEAFFDLSVFVPPNKGFC